MKDVLKISILLILALSKGALFAPEEYTEKRTIEYW